MAGPWLYPISRRGGRTFALRDQPIEVNLDNFKSLVGNGRLVEDEFWFLARHWKDIEPWDEMFIYSGDGDAGIIGYATVRGVEQRAGSWVALPNWDLRRCELQLA